MSETLWKLCHHFTPTTVHVLLCMSMALVKKQKIYWSTDFLLSTPAFGKLMSRDRFLLLLHHLHFYDNSQHTEYRLAKMGRIMNDIKNKYSTKFKPFQDLCADESLVLCMERKTCVSPVYASEAPRVRTKLFIYVMLRQAAC